MSFILRKGSKGPRVAELQGLLKKAGYWKLDITQNFGPVTEVAVKVFQKDKGLKEDGVVGPSTWGVLSQSVASTIKPITKPVASTEDFSDPEDEMLVEKIKEAYPTCKNIPELVKLINDYKLTRKVNRVVYHCTATQPEATIVAIMKYWKEKLKWKSPGYHILVTADGSWTLLQDFNLPSNGVQGINFDTIHISYIGGIDKTGKARDTRTGGQHAVFEACYHLLSKKLPKATHHGHYEFDNKACPSFKVDSWIKKIKE
jgi:N-acetylmuramoyl-L-alanine amidase